MDTVFDRLKKTLQEATDAIKGQASNIGDSAKEKSYKIINEWIGVFPILEKYGLKITSFALGVAISPSLEVELVGRNLDFPMARLRQILDETKKISAAHSVFTVIKTTYNLHEKTGGEMHELLIVKIRIKFSPEIQVFVGEPVIQ